MCQGFHGAGEDYHRIFLYLYPNMSILTAIEHHVVSMLTKGLSTSLSYHDVNHTLDVTAQCRVIAHAEKINDPQSLAELEIASLYHDTGFLYVYENHEEKGCELAREQLPAFGVSPEAIENICALIMATKVPQTPRNELQKIICDADLDYLGRDDFFETGERLRQELMSYKFIKDDQDWEDRQLSFLKTHQYFTRTCRDKRSREKLKFIRQLESLSNPATK